MAVNYPGRIAAIDVHYNPLDSFYLQEAYDRIHYYPPPYFGMYTSPWLWYDGNQHGGFDYTVWEPMITARMALDAPVTITINGSYNPGTGNGDAIIRFQNDSSAAINGRVIIVITEDSLFYPAPNGSIWHNHVPRDYLPDQNGSVVSIPAGEYIDVNQSFTIDPIWNANYCKLLAFIQDDVMQADSTKEIWQGAIVDVIQIGVGEYQSAKKPLTMRCYPNPAHDHINFALTAIGNSRYSIDIYDASGRHVRSLEGMSTDTGLTDRWDLLDQSGNRVAPGVYLFRLSTSCRTTNGKVIVD